MKPSPPHHSCLCFLAAAAAISRFLLSRCPLADSGGLNAHGSVETHTLGCEGSQPGWSPVCCRLCTSAADSNQTVNPEFPFIITLPLPVPFRKVPAVWCVDGFGAMHHDQPANEHDFARLRGEARLVASLFSEKDSVRRVVRAGRGLRAALAALGRSGRAVQRVTLLSLPL